LSKHILSTRLPKNYISIKASLGNYDGLAGLKEHIQNICSNLKLIIHDHDSMCKILLTTFKGSAHAWYNNLESNSIEGFSDICAKLVAHFSTNIPANKNYIRLFSVAP
jgi:hypothetical protein